MAKLCHDQYDHPLLWCETKRRAEEKRIANESWTLAQQRKEQAEIQKIRERNDLHDLIEKHYPWGKPGGGAPNETIRRNNITSRGLFPEVTENCRRTIFQVPFRVKYGGGGAPLRKSGQIITKFHNDPDITFNDSARKHVENHLRYKTSNAEKKQYKMDLDRCRKQRDIKNTIDMLGNWGRSGAAPWRNQRHVGQSFMKSMGWTDKTLLQTMDPEKKLCTDVNQAINQKLPTKCCINCFCECNQLNVCEQNIGKENSAQENVGNLCEHTNRISRKCKYSKPRTCMISSGVELVPLLARRRAMQRPISLSTTDVTKYATNKMRHNNDDGIKLLDDLCRQISQKERRNQISKDCELESARRHFETIDTFWGRPGHGAPRNIKTKLNLNDLLYKPWT